MKQRSLVNAGYISLEIALVNSATGERNSETDGVFTLQEKERL